jgi:hypothetical protein
MNGVANGGLTGLQAEATLDKEFSNRPKERTRKETIGKYGTTSGFGGIAGSDKRLSWNTW